MSCPTYERELVVDIADGRLSDNSASVLWIPHGRCENVPALARAGWADVAACW